MTNRKLRMYCPLSGKTPHGPNNHRHWHRTRGCRRKPDAQLQGRQNLERSSLDRRSRRLRGKSHDQRPCPKQSCCKYAEHLSEIDIYILSSALARISSANCRSGFLHALEFYDGILFLTTNRVGTFDDAIMSRVHIQMFYPDLNADERYTVWNTFINKLEAEKPSMQVKYAVKEYLRSSEMKNFEMNGREIRNGENININWI